RDRNVTGVQTCALPIYGGSISIGRGDIAIIITMLTFAIFIVFIQWLAKYINSIQITLLTNAFGLAFLLPFLPTVDSKQIMEVDIKLRSEERRVGKED